MENSRKKKFVLQQVLDPSGDGGVSAEYRALQQSSLKDKYHFESMILKECHAGVNLKDICFYYQQIKNKQPDIVHIRGAAPDGLNAVIAAVLTGKTKILVTVHGMYSDLVYISPIKKWVSKYVIEPMIFNCAHGISCVYQAAAERDVFKKYKAKLLPHVYNRMPDYSALPKENIRFETRSKLNIADDAVVGVYVGRVTREKGLAVLYDVLLKLDQDGCTKFELIMVGDGEYRQQFEENCRKMINGIRIHFLGRQTEIYRYLFASDFFVLPSLHENHSISLLEATAAGLPIIATRAGGNAEIVSDGKTGILVHAGDENELRAAMKKMIEDTVFRQSLANMIEKTQYPQFGNVCVDKQLDCVYSKLLND